MIKIQDVLIPLRFSSLMIQIIFSMVCLFMRVISIITLYQSDENASDKKTILVACIFFYVLELAELVIMLTGVTLFQNKLGLFRI